MIDSFLEELENIAKEADQGRWDNRIGYHIFSGKRHIASAREVYCYEEDENTSSEEASANAKYIASASPQTILSLLKRLKYSYELIDTITEAALMTEGIARNLSYFDNKKYEEICSKIPELREKSGIGNYFPK